MLRLFKNLLEIFIFVNVINCKIFLGKWDLIDGIVDVDF